MGEVTSMTLEGIREFLFSVAIVDDDLVFTKGDNSTIIIPIADLGVSQEDLDAAIAAVVDSSPAALDTLNELAAALGDDENFAATVTALIGTKADAASLTAHETDTTNIHGIDNTNFLMRVVVHGADGNVARPTGGTSIVVHWIGTADPVNAGENDLWTNI